MDYQGFRRPKDTRRIEFRYNSEKTWADVRRDLLFKAPTMLVGAGLVALGSMALLDQATHVIPAYYHQLLSSGQLAWQPISMEEGFQHAITFCQDLGPQFVETINKGGPIVFGLGASLGGVKNLLLIKKTLKALEKKTSPSTGHVFETITDGNGHQTKVFNIHCSDFRVVDKTGGDFPGSFAMFGAELKSLIEAGVWSKLINPHSNIAADFLAGYLVGSNILTTSKSLGSLMSEIQKCVLVARSDNSDPNARIEIKMHDHFDGCGAEAFTSALSYIAKFGLHNFLYSADLLAIPNEVLGYIMINSIGSVLTAALSGGQVHLTAVLEHSEMREAN